MSCLITSAIALDCMSSVGGIKVAYILAGDITSTTETSNEISAIVGTGHFYEFQLAKDTASFKEAVTVSNANGTVFYKGDLSIVLQKMDAVKRNQLLLLAQNRALRIVFVDNNGQSYIMGLTRGAMISAASADSGKAIGDLNGYTITFESQEPHPTALLAGDISTVVSGITIVSA